MPTERCDWSEESRMPGKAGKNIEFLCEKQTPQPGALSVAAPRFGINHPSSGWSLQARHNSWLRYSEEEAGQAGQSAG